MTRRTANWVLGMFFGATALACGAEVEDTSVLVPADDESVVVPLGKEDNFLASSAQEYLLEGEATIALEGADAELTEPQKLDRVKRLIPFKQIAIGWFLNSYIVSKDHKATNKDYGDFHSLTKNGSYEELDIQAVDVATYRFTFRQEIGGPLDLLSRMPAKPGADGVLAFDLAVGKVSNEEMQKLDTNNEWYRNAPWSAFDPSKLSKDQYETLSLKIKPQPRSSDGWIDEKTLYADGKVTVGVHFGWDYHSEYHLKHAEEVYGWLEDRGFKSPVATFASYTRTSGPLTRSITVNGKPATVEVSLFWGKPGTDTDPDTAAGGIQLEKDMRQSLAEKEVIIYSGHSGPFYGFALANWRKTDEGDLDDSEIPGLTLPQSYQVVLAEGCETYAIGQAFWDNPAKSSRKNLDVLTTTSFSNAATASTVTDFLTAVFGTDSQARHVPMTYGQLLRKMDTNAWASPMYGVHGIDDNPHLHPNANTAKFCASCQVNADCGEVGNICAKLGTSRVCTAACTADDGCPTGFTCAALASGVNITGRVCVAAGFTCSAPPPQVSAVMLNEILADPATDANLDGKKSTSEDEFVEIVNASDVAAKLGGYTLSDGIKVRYTFPAAATLPARSVAVVFGGGSPKAGPNAGGAQLHVAKGGLGLNNGGDTVTLRDSAGKIVATYQYGAEGGKDRSLTRATDADPKAAFVAHPGSEPSSPGTKSDGSAF